MSPVDEGPVDLGGMTPAENVVRRMYVAYHAQDIETARGLLSDNLQFTSPQDDHIGKDVYLAVCFPTADRFVKQQLREVTEVETGLVFLRYVYELADGHVFSNVECHLVRDGRIHDIQVYFGGAATFDH